MKPPIIALLVIAAGTHPAFAVSGKATSGKASAEAALARAETGARQAAALNDQWTPTIAALNAARAACKAGDYAKARRLAARAAKFAALSAGQAREQKQLWRNEVVH